MAAAEPIRGMKAVQAIKKLLGDNPRDLLLFTLGVNSGLSVADLLNIKVAQLEGLKVGDSVFLIDSKTGKPDIFVYNQEIDKAFAGYLRELKPEPGDYLFKSRKGNNQPLTVNMVSKLIKSWTEAINLAGNYGAHTLRKTWAYHQRVTYGVDTALISKRLNHSSTAITMRYLGFKPDDVTEILTNII